MNGSEKKDKSSTNQLTNQTYIEAQGCVGLEFDNVEPIKNLIDQVTEDYNKKVLNCLEHIESCQNRLRFSSLDIREELQQCFASVHRQNRSLNNFKERLDKYEKKVRQTEQSIIDQLSKITLDDAANQAPATALPLSSNSSESIALLKSSDITVAQETNRDTAKELYQLWKKLLDTYGANIFNLVGKLGKWVEDGVEDVEEFWEKVKNSPEYQNACSNATEEPEVTEKSAEDILLDDLQKFLEHLGQIPVYGDKADFMNEVINLVRGTEPEEVTAEELLESSLDEMQAKLDAVGIVPVAGDAADAVNSVIYAARGKKKDALISGISMISLIGDVSKMGKYATKGVKTVSKIADATLVLVDDIVDIVKVSNNVSDSKKFINKVEKVGEVVEDAAKVASKANSKILRQNMIDAGTVVPKYPNAAHHIVAGNSPKAAGARKILEKYGIDINDAANGVFLPTTKNIENSAYHPSIHTNAYYNEINKQLLKAKSKEDALSILDDIAEQLQDGSFMK